jgi:hypothetical protein
MRMSTTFEQALAFECAEYIYNDDRERDDFKQNPSPLHIYYKAQYVVEGPSSAVAMLRRELKAEFLRHKKKKAGDDAGND